MKDKLIKIKRSRLKQEELFLTDMLNDLEFLEFKDNIHWVKYDNGIYIKTYFTYNPREKYIHADKSLVFDEMYKLFYKDINISKSIVDFFSSQFKIEINNYKQSY